MTPCVTGRTACLIRELDARLADLACRIVRAEYRGDAPAADAARRERDRIKSVRRLLVSSN
jgi:hypothetical protein